MQVTMSHAQVSWHVLLPAMVEAVEKELDGEERENRPCIFSEFHAQRLEYMAKIIRSRLEAKIVGR